MATSKDKCESSSSLYLHMEAQRKKIPNMCRNEYVSVFIMDILLELLKSGNNDEEFEFSTLCSLDCDDDFSKSPENFSGATETKYLLPEGIRKHIFSVLHFAELAYETFKIDKSQFCELFAKKIEFPCLELLWILDKKSNLLKISSYLMHLEHEKHVDHITKQILSLCLSSDALDPKLKSFSTQMLYDFLEVAVIAAYCNPLENKLLEDFQKRADEILTQICNMLVSTNSTKCSFMTQQFLITVFQELPVPKSVKCRFLSHQIKHNLMAENFENVIDSMDVIQHQERFAQPSESPKVSFFAMLTGPPQSCQEVLELLEKSLSGSVVHWENALLVLTEWIKRREYEAISLLREMIKRLMKTGLSSKSEQDVITAFILARHCSLVAPREFLRYEKWYTNMFESDVYSPAKDPEAFNFLTNLLSKWIPLEPPCFLQVHATFWPYVPPGCRNIFSDYVSLAKVRIAEYNEVEKAMEFEPNPNNPLQHDVEMAIKTYDNTKKTPQSIGQMWMFRRQYYLENFLPTLLKKPPGATLTDARLRLIEVLNREGKIPPDVYAAYKVANQLTQH